MRSGSRLAAWIPVPSMYTLFHAAGVRKVIWYCGTCSPRDKRVSHFVRPMCLKVPVRARISLADIGQVHRAVAVTAQQRGSQITSRVFRTWTCRAWCLKVASKAGCPRRVNIWSTCKNTMNRSGENGVLDDQSTDD